MVLADWPDRLMNLLSVGRQTDLIDLGELETSATAQNIIVLDHNPNPYTLITVMDFCFGRWLEHACPLTANCISGFSRMTLEPCLMFANEFKKLHTNIKSINFYDCTTPQQRPNLLDGAPLLSYLSPSQFQKYRSGYENLAAPFTLTEVAHLQFK